MKIFRKSHRKKPSKALAEPKVVLAIGGAKGIGFELLLRFPMSSMHTLYILGRSDSQNPEVSKNLEQLSKTWREVHYTQADATNKNDFMRAISQIQRKHSYVDYLLNTCGQRESGLPWKKHQQTIDDEIRSKILPIINLRFLKGILGVQHFITASSIISDRGYFGESIYAFSNKMMEHLTESYLSYISHTNAIQWPGWKNIGMLADPKVENHLQSNSAVLIEAETAADLFYSHLEECKSLGTLLVLDESSYYKHLLKRKESKQKNSSLGDFAENHGIRYTNSISILKHPFLKHHKIGDKFILPLIFGLNQFLSILQRMELMVYKLKNITVHFPLEITSSNCQIDTVCLHNQSKLKIETNLRSTYLEAYFQTEKDSTPSKESFFQEKATSLNYDYQLSQNQIYGSDKLFHTGCFQLLDKIEISSNQRSSRATLLPTTLHNETSLNYSAFLIESGLQGLGLTCGKNNKITFLPQKIDLLTFARPIDSVENYRVFSSIQSSSKREIIGECFIVDSKGKIVIHMEGVRLTSLQRQEATTELDPGAPLQTGPKVSQQLNHLDI